MVEITKEIVDETLHAIEVAKATGKIKKGTNEVTKALERGTAKIVAVAKDANPAEIVMHIPLLAKEKGIVCVQVESKEELGASSGIEVPTASVAVVQEGEAKKIIASINAKLEIDKKAEDDKKAEEKASEEKSKEKSEEKSEEKVAEKSEEKKEKAEKKAEKSEEKSEEKPEEKAEEKPEEKSEEKKE